MGNPATLGNRCDHPDPALGININTSHGDTGFDGGALFDLTVPYLRLVVSRVRLRATMLFLILLLGGFTVGIHGYARHRIQNLVVFGDSYTDEGRLGYFLGTGGVAPPPGTIIPTSNATAGGGYSWPYYASKQLGAATYNYAGKRRCHGKACDSVDGKYSDHSRQSLAQPAQMKLYIDTLTRSMDHIPRSSTMRSRHSKPTSSSPALTPKRLYSGTAHRKILSTRSGSVPMISGTAAFCSTYRFQGRPSPTTSTVYGPCLTGSTAREGANSRSSHRRRWNCPRYMLRSRTEAPATGDTGTTRRHTTQLHMRRRYANTRHL